MVGVGNFDHWRVREEGDYISQGMKLAAYFHLVPSLGHKEDVFFTLL